jgi:uncharacterized protein YcbK (DUF882 family)
MTEYQFFCFINDVCRNYGGSVSSMHRTKAHNAAVGGANNSQHLYWKAADIVLDNWDFKNAAIKFLQERGLFVLDEVETRSHLHVDDRNNA